MNHRFGTRPRVILLIFLVCLSIVAFVASQASTLLPTTSFVGQWDHVETSNAAYLELSEDGTFTMSNVPRAVVTLYGNPAFGKPARWNDTVSGEGIWSLDHGAIRLILKTGTDYGWGSSATIEGWFWDHTRSVRFGPAESGNTFDFGRAG